MRKMARRGLSLVLSFLIIGTTAFSDLSMVSFAADTDDYVWTKVAFSDISETDSIAITMTTSDGTTYVLPNAATSKVPTAVVGTVSDGMLTIADGADSDYAWTITKYTETETIVDNTTNETESEVEKTQVEDVSESSSEVVDAETKSEVSETTSLEGKTDEASEEKSETKSEATSEDESGTRDTTVQTETVDEVDSNTDNEAEKKTVTKTVEKVYYTISNGSNYLYTIAKNDGIRVSSMPSDKTGAQWDVDSATGYLCAIDPKSEVRYLGVYTANPDWRGYTITTGNIKNQTLGFYKLTKAGSITKQCATVEASVESGAVAGGTEVELSCKTEGASIYYNINGTSNYSKYTEAISITKDSVIYAYAQAEGYEDSTEATFEYTLKGGSKLDTLAEGQEFVLVFSSDDSKYILSTDKSGKGLGAVDGKLDDDSLLTYQDKEATIATLKLTKVQTVEDVKEYYITTDVTENDEVITKYLTTSSTGNSLSLEAEANDYSLWTVTADEGQFLIGNVNASYLNKKTNVASPQYLEFYNNIFTAYSYVEGTTKRDNYTFEAYTYPELSEEEAVEEDDDNTIATLLTREFYDGDEVVVYYPADSKVMTTKTSGGKFTAADAALSEDGTLDTKDLDALVLTVSVDESGYYTFKDADGNALTSGSTGSSLSLAEASEYSLWTLSKAGDTAGDYYLVNVNAKYGSSNQYLEYYKAFTTYTYKSASDSAYVFNFYLLKAGSKTLQYDKDKQETVAQWAGQWGSDISFSGTTVYGDEFQSNDMLDKNATYQAVVNGTAVTPYSKGASNKNADGSDGTTTYYMGGENVGTSSNDYLQFVFSSAGYANMTMSFRMRTSNSGAAEFQLQYSTDGKSFSNFTTGTYNYSYTAYVNGEQSEKKGSGDITDGIAKPSFAPGQYVEFSFDVPEQAADADELTIRLVPGTTSVKGGTIPKGSTIRIDVVEVVGNAVVDESKTGYVSATPDSGEVAIGELVTLASSTAGADIYYSLNGADYVKYDADKKLELTELPVTLKAYAIKDGLEKSITSKYTYTQAQVSAVKATPNGGAVVANQRLTLKTATDDATILYSISSVTTDDADEDTPDDNGATDTESETIDDSDTADDKDTDDDADTSEDSADESEIEWQTYDGPITLTSLPVQVKVKAVKDGFIDSAVSTLKFTQKENEKYNIYFGQIHAHTNISDGSGDIAEAYEHASQVANLDFIAITDHSNSIDNAADSKITENVDNSETDEWTYAHKVAQDYTTDDFTCVYGYEMTWSNGLGHMNTYNTAGFQSRTQTAYATYSTALQNYYAALRTSTDSISQFNHPGTTFGDFSDFSYYTEENDALITMIEVGNGEGTIGSSGYFPSYEYYTRALDKGWHVAPTNNQDNHKGKWGDANTARTVMLSDTNDEDAIYDAMRNYRIYATEDNDLSIYYTLDGYIMGTILEQEQVGDSVELSVDISDPTDDAIGKVEVIVNGGQSIANQTVSSNTDTVTFNVPSSYSYYYIKITEADGDIAVTAPVWVGDVEACGINSTYTNSALAVAGESLDVNVDLYNNEKTDLVIDDIEIVLSDVDENKTEVVSLNGEEAGIATVASNGTATFSTDYVYNSPGQVTYNITVHASLDGVAKTYTDKLTVSYVISDMVTNVIVDGTHYNDYVTGYYGGNLTSFVSICADANIKATIETEEITKEDLEDCALLILSAPAKKSGTANAGDYTPSHYSDEFIAMVAEYVKNGGSVIVCGLADYSDTTSGQTATEQNKLLEAIGSTIRMNSDEVCDDTNNGGQIYRLYPENFNMDSAFLKGVVDGQKYSQYSGCSVDISNQTATDFVSAPVALVSGFDTTYSIDCKDASGNSAGNTKNDNMGNVTFLATQETSAGGNIFVAGGVFMSDFEVDAEIDNNDSLPYANYNIIKNIIGDVTVELPTSTIAEARAGSMNEVFAVEGYVTSGTSNENTTFFDTIYIQDETAGIDIFPYAESGLEIGTKMRIVGYVAQYQGDLELKVISSQILDDDPYVWAPQEVDTATAMDYDALGGSLLKTTGKVTRVTYGSDGATVEEFWLMDNTGVEAAIFIDGYINSGTTGENNVGDFVKVGATVSAIGVLYMHPEGDSDVSVPVFRVRDCDDISLIDAATVDNNSDSSAGSSSSSSSSAISNAVSNAVSSVVSAVQNAVQSIVDTVTNAIEQSPVAQIVNRIANRNNGNNQAAEVADDETAEDVEDTDAAETEAVIDDAEESTEIADDEVPTAGDKESSIPVVPVAAASAIIIIAGAGVILAKTGKLAMILKMLGIIGK